MAGLHARLSASSASRWMHCPGSQVRVDMLASLGVEDDETEYSAEGSCAHEGASEALINGYEPWLLIGEKLYTDSNGKEWEFTAEMAEHVTMYTTHIRERYSDGVEMIVEERLEDPELGADVGGTLDCAVYQLKDNGGFVHVFDFKYGIGVSVPVGEEDEYGTRMTNTQLKYYLYLLLRKLGVSPEDDVSVGATIVQPRDKIGNPIREAWASSKEIFAWANTELLPAMKRTSEPGAELKPGDWCQFCPAKLLCPTMKGMFAGAAQADPLEIPEMTNERLGLEYELIDPVKKYIRAIEDECYRRALAGDPVPGSQLEKGRADRQWKQEVELPDGRKVDVESFLRETLGGKAYTEPSLKSPAQIEKEVGGKELVARAAFKPEPRPILKPIRPGREAVKPNFGGGVFAGVQP